MKPVVSYIILVCNCVCTWYYLVRSHLLNIDVVTLFDPHLTDKLRQTTEQCENCLQRMKEREDHMNQLIEN